MSCTRQSSGYQSFVNFKALGFTKTVLTESTERNEVTTISMENVSISFNNKTTLISSLSSEFYSTG